MRLPQLLGVFNSNNIWIVSFLKEVKEMSP